MKKITLFVLSLFVIHNVLSQITFERNYGDENSYYSYAVEQCSDDSYLSAGYFQNSISNEIDIYLIKTDFKGDTLWTKKSGLPGLDIAFDMRITADGGSAITGYTNEDGMYKVLIMKTDAVGDILWTQSYCNITATDTIGYFGQSISMTSDGGYIVTGYTSKPDYTNDIFLLKTNSEGDILWVKEFDKDEGDMGKAVKETSDGDFIIARSTSYMWYKYVYIIKTNESGDTLWTKTYGESESQEAYDIELMDDGSFTICGSIMDEETYTNNVYFIQCDSEGNPLWEKSVGGPFDEMGTSLCTTEDGGFVSTGQFINYPTIDVFLVKLNSDGDTLWTRTYGFEGIEQSYSIKPTMDGGLIVSGCTFDPETGLSTLYLLKTDGLGNTVGLEDAIMNSTLNIYPNPSSGLTYFTANKTISSIYLYNTSGQLVYSKTLNSKDLELNLSDLNSGFYFINILIDGQLYNRSIIIE